MNQTTNQGAHVHGYEIPMLCGCARDGSFICGTHGGWIPPELDTEISRLREVEEREIGALAVLVEGPNSVGWCELFCSRCIENICAFSTPRELAETAFAANWQVMIEDMGPWCPVCQQREDVQSDADALSDWRDTFEGDD